MRKKLALLALFVACTAATVVVLRRPLGAEKEGFRTGVFEPARDAPEFELDGSGGTKLHLHDYAGKVVVLEFGFTSCQLVCPVTLANLAKVDRKLGAAANDVQVIYVTVDPKRDSVARLHEYLGGFDARFVGATGTEKELEAVRHAYGILAEQVAVPNSELGYTMSHSSFIYLIDRHGKIRALVPFGQAVDDIVHDIELLLKS